MDIRDPSDRLDRHALVLAVWLPLVFVAATLFRHGFDVEGLWWIAGGFAALLAAFAGHVIVNVVLGTDFTPREVALGLLAFAIATLALMLSFLRTPDFADTFLLPMALGLVALVAAVVFYLVTAHGTRSAFDLFDIIRNNNPRASSRLERRGRRP